MISQNTFMTLVLTGIVAAAAGISQAIAQYPPMQMDGPAIRLRQQIRGNIHPSRRHNTDRSHNSHSTGHSISLKLVVMAALHRTADRLPMVDQVLMPEGLPMDRRPISWRLWCQIGSLE